MRRYEITVQYPEPTQSKLDCGSYRVLETYVGGEHDITNRVATAIAHGASLIIVKYRS